MKAISGGLMLCALLSFNAWASDVQAAAPAAEIIRCEYILSAKDHLHVASNKIMLATAVFHEPHPIGIAKGTTRSALDFFDIGNWSDTQLSALKFKLIPKRHEILGDITEYDLEIHSEGGFHHETFSDIPIFAWQAMPGSEEEFDDWFADSKLQFYDLEVPSLPAASLGAVKSAGWSKTRKFIQIIPHAGKTIILLGLDVNCEDKTLFTSDRDVRKIRTSEGWLCRIPVLAAGI